MKRRVWLSEIKVMSAFFPYLTNRKSSKNGEKCLFFSFSIAKVASKKIEALISSAKFLSSKVSLYLYNSLIHLMCAITRVHGSTCANSLMCVKNTMHHFCLWHLLPGTVEWRKLKNKNNKLNCWSFFLNFC